MALHWQKTSDECDAPDCACQEPSEAPQYAGQIAHTPCESVPSSSDQASSGHTSDSQLPSGSDDLGSDSSGDCGGECMWIWYASTGWQVGYSYCLPPGLPPAPYCGCKTPPESPGEYEGQTKYMPCGWIVGSDQPSSDDSESDASSDSSSGSPSSSPSSVWCWKISYESCSPNYQCLPAPDRPPAYEMENVIVKCNGNPFAPGCTWTGSFQPGFCNQ